MRNGTILDDRAFDPACPLNWDHPLNRGITLELVASRNAGWSGGLLWRNLVRGGKLANDAALTGGPTWAGPLGRPGGTGTIKFDGSDDYALVTGYQHGSTTEFTLSAWMYPLDLDSDYVVDSNNEISIVTGFGTDNWRILIRGTYSGGQISKTLNTWQHICFTTNSTTCKGFLNGVEVVSGTSGSVGSVNSTLNIGRYSGVGNYYNGYADEFVLRNTYISPATAMAYYQESLQGNPNRYNLISNKKYFFLNSVAVTPDLITIPRNHITNPIKIIMTGTGTSFSSSTVLTPDHGTTDHIEVQSATVLWYFYNPDATYTGTVTVTESVTGTATATFNVVAATISVSPTEGYTGSTTNVTITSTAGVYLQETPVSMFSVDAGASISNVVVIDNNNATADILLGFTGTTLTDETNNDLATATFGPLYLVTANVGTYTLTGVDVLFYEKILTLDVGSFTLTGQAVNLLVGYLTTSSPGSYTLVGEDVLLIYGSYLLSDVGAYVCTGIDSGLILGRVATSDVGSYSYTGIDVTLLQGFVLPADLSVFTLTGISTTISIETTSGHDLYGVLRWVPNRVSTVLIGNDNTLWLAGVRDSTDPTNADGTPKYIDDCTVTWEIRDQQYPNGTLFGQGNGIPVGSGGEYRIEIGDAITLALVENDACWLNINFVDTDSNVGLISARFIARVRTGLTVGT